MSHSFPLLLSVLLIFVTPCLAQQTALERTLPKTVKVYGVGGLAGLDDSQSGILISDKGLILTTSGSILDEEPINVTLNDGQKFEAKIIGIDPKLQIAILKIETNTPEYFDLKTSPQTVTVGMPVLAITNLYNIATGNEPMSVQHGIISAVTSLEARRGAFIVGYKGNVYIIDAITNNPGAPGGVLVDYQGNFLGLIGKQLTGTTQSIYINFAFPQSALATSVENIIIQKNKKSEEQKEIKKPADAWTIEKLGFQLSPDVLPRTPAFVDFVEVQSPAARAGLQSDDLIVMINGKIVKDIKALKSMLEYIDTADTIELLIQRHNDFQTIRVSN